MFEYLGREDGERDGNADACDGLEKDPRPNLKTSLLSTGYSNSYFNAYHSAYNLQARVNRECEFHKRVSMQRAENLKKTRQQIHKNTQADKFREH